MQNNYIYIENAKHEGYIIDEIYLTVGIPPTIIYYKNNI